MTGLRDRRADGAISAAAMTNASTVQEASRN